MILSAAERQKFIQYLKTKIDSDKLIVEQMEKMNMPANLVKHNKQTLVAYMIVHNDLCNIMDDAIDASKPNPPS